MDRILIVGNGLTANLIPEYQHKAMMKKIKEEIPRLFDKADKLFAPFRNKDEIEVKTSDPERQYPAI